MFHHFHNENHPVGQGSMSGPEFAAMIDWLAARYNILGAAEYLNKLKAGTLAPHDICFTFDDALLCQSEIAVPIMREKGITAYFFVYSSPFMGNPDYLEIYRYFRTVTFKSVDEFYVAFSNAAQKHHGPEYAAAEQSFDANEYLKAFPFYTVPDKWFRYLRDIGLGKDKYEALMQSLMRDHGFEPLSVMKKLWMDDAGLKALEADGHIIGLHSYSHPTVMHRLDKSVQADEYAKNHAHLSRVLTQPIVAMSHPCGNYNADTLDILNGMGIEIGFRSNNSVTDIKSHLEIPREDHANVMKEMAS
ncbi:MAG: polysaccharide deacetylase family protein [Alphaproteobacteria bacterium]|nr:polysaccharide deacetylase family protein [Alphaproteobacteria bacterium]